MKRKKLIKKKEKQPLHIKYRPEAFQDVIGQKDIVESLASVVGQGQRAFLFSGPSGCGKTTLCRIIAKAMLLELIEVDAASNNGIDYVRELISLVSTKPFGYVGRALLLDECHSLSSQAWQALLKSVEEPPNNTYFLFSTTNFQKVPRSIVTRCASYKLKEVRSKELKGYLEYVCKEEGIELDDEMEKIVNKIAKAANGSPRAALVMLDQVRHDGLDIQSIVDEYIDIENATPSVIEYCRSWSKGRGLSLSRFIALIQQMEKEGLNAESVRMIVISYFYKVVCNAKSHDAAYIPMMILDRFSGQVFPSNEKLVPVMLATFDILEELDSGN